MRMFIIASIVAGLVTVSAAQNPAPPSPAPVPPAQTQSATQAHGAGGDMAAHMRMMNEMMVKQLGQTDPDYEKRFIDMMIPHHEGAVLMAKHALEHANRPEVKEMAQKMIDSQQKEIEQLKKWRQEWYGNR